jgi:hypothetical protein
MIDKDSDDAGAQLPTKSNDPEILEEQFTDSNLPPAVTAAPEKPKPEPEKPLPPVGHARLVSGSATLASGGAAFQLRSPDATRKEMHLIVSSGTATDMVRVASTLGDANHDLTAYLIPVGVEVVLRDFTGPVWVALSANSTGPAAIAMTSVVE